MLAESLVTSSVVTEYNRKVLNVAADKVLDREDIWPVVVVLLLK